MSYIDPLSNSRSRLLGSSDHESLLRESFLSPGLQTNINIPGPKLRQLSNYLSNNVFLEDEWHSEDYLNLPYEEYRTGDDSWRLKGRMKTSGVALVICLNIGVDPPDVIKPNPCARKECWFDPTVQKSKGLEYVGNALQQQYEKWQSKAKFKQCLDPSSEDLRKICLNLRKNCKGDRLLFHYNGHGVPKPTKNGELWVFGKHHTHYTPVAVREVRSWLADPTIYVLDCSGAGVLIPHLIEGGNNNDSTNSLLAPSTPYDAQDRNNTTALSFASAQNSLDSGSVVLTACKASEQLPFHPNYPADIFTSCLTTPTTIAVRWFILQNPQSMRDVSPDLAETIPGKDNERKTPRGELNWILTAITDTIAWNTLPAKMFKRMFRHDLLVASLFRNFLMAKRIMKSFNCTPQSYPPLPDSTTHSLWQAWDMALGSFLTQHISLQKGSSMIHPLNNLYMPNNLQFFNDQLNAFEMWLEFGTSSSQPPLQLPVVLQVLLSQSHRLRALQLLKRYLALGLEAVKTSLILGIYPYIVKLLQNPADETKQILISIWAAIIAFDPSCKQELIREKSQIYFIQCMTNSNLPIPQRCLATFVLAEICSNNKEGQQSCIQLSLHRSCTNCLQDSNVMKHNTMKLWICLCLFKYCEDNLWAKYLCVTEGRHTQTYPLLVDPDPAVRTACILALGELFGASSLSHNQHLGTSSANGSSSNLQAANAVTPNRSFYRSMQTSFSSDEDNHSVRTSSVDEKDLIEAELQLALQLLECCTDGSIMVRMEAVYALSKFFIQPAHIDCVKIVAKAIYERYYEKKSLTISSSNAALNNLNGSNHGSANKAERRSASPDGSTAGSANSASGNNYLHNKMIFPWFLTPMESKAIAEQVEAFIEIRSSEHFFNTGSNPASNTNSSMNAAHIDTSSPPSSRSQLLEGKYSSDKLPVLEKDRKPSLPTLMASAYVRLWLALIEVEHKDPHTLISQAVATIRNRIYILVALDEKEKLFPRIESNASNAILLHNAADPADSSMFSDSNAIPFPNTSFQSPLTPGQNLPRSFFSPSEGGNASTPSAQSAANNLSMYSDFAMANSMSTTFQESNSGKGDAFYLQPMSPILSNSFSSPGRNKSLRHTVSFIQQQSQSLGSSSAKHLPHPLHMSSSFENSGSIIEGNLGNNNNQSPHNQQVIVSLGPGGKSKSTTPIKNIFLDHYKEYLKLQEEDVIVCFSSNHYEMMKKKFIEPSVVQSQSNSNTPATFSMFDNENSGSYKEGLQYDPLSQESKFIEYRAAKIHEMLLNERTLADAFKEVEDRSQDIVYMERTKNKLFDDPASSHQLPSKSPGPALISNSSNICKFEQKGNTLAVDTNMIPSITMFHAFQDILVVAHSSTAEIWSTATHSRIMEIKNKHHAKALNHAQVSAIPSHNQHVTINNHLTSSNLLHQDILANNHSNIGRITAMTWINESYDSLLLLGSDDGVVHVWRDVSHSEPVSNNSNNNVTNSSSPAAINSQVELATALVALPDIDLASRGSGTVLSWQQTAGTLVVGGNSSTIRVWDLGREQNVRTFYTGHETCVTALATTTVSNRFSSSILTPASCTLQPDIDGTPVTWTFAGFADGSIAVFDERVNTNGGRVHFSHTHSNWVSHCYLRADVPEVVIGSVRGAVKFWDLRTQRTYKTLEVQKSALTALAVHPCAPIMATGSHAQFIKILTLSGEQIGNIIKYYDGFLGQRIGPVSSLAFHPHKLLLAASSTDGVVSLYGASI